MFRKDMIRTKIIATMGPSIESYEKLFEICRYADIIRFNFSHEPKKQLERVKKVKAISKKMNKNIITLADLEGPKIRTGNEEQIELSASTEYSIDVLGIKDKAFYEKIEKGDIIFIDDGKLELRMKTNDKFKPLNNYVLKPNKTVTIKGKDFDMYGLTEKDKRDLNEIKKNDFDAIAMSFVKSAKELQLLKI